MHFFPFLFKHIAIGPAVSETQGQNARGDRRKVEKMPQNFLTIKIPGIQILPKKLAKIQYF